MIVATVLWLVSAIVLGMVDYQTTYHIFATTGGGRYTPALLGPERLHNLAASSAIRTVLGTICVYVMTIGVLAVMHFSTRPDKA